MTASGRQRDRPATLAVKAMRAEALVLRHRRQAGVHAFLLGEKLRAQLTSPSALLLAAGVGFVTERFTRPRSSVQNGIEHTGGADTGPFAKALRLAGLVGSLVKAFAPAEPAVQPEYPYRVPARQFVAAGDS